MSYTNGSGGTLTLPSPTHVHHVDVTSAVRSLRHSLSRSPSKFGLVTEKSPSLSPKSPLSPSPTSPTKRVTSQPTATLTSTPTHTSSPLARPFPPSSVKLSLRSANRSKAVTPRATSRTRMSPKSPLKRALSSTSDSGNSQPSSSSGSSIGQENRRSESKSPTVRKSLETQRILPFDIEVAAPVNLPLSRLGDGRSDCGGTAVVTFSPLKRNDAIMNLDQASLGSPVAKRRSLHGSAGLGHDFNVFDLGPKSPPFEIHDDSSQEYQLSACSISAGNSLGSALTTLPRRSSSLRKSTLQQRHGDKTSWGRRHAVAQDVSSSLTDMATPVLTKNRPRLSVDHFVAPMPRDSPFASQGSLPSASVHVVSQSHQINHQPHPLSRTMTTSSSNSSLADESPTHVPVHFGEQRPKLDFSKSLPVGALRPFALETAAHDHSSSESFATPDNYKSAKPLPAAFMSTGLISKVNRNLEEPQLLRGVSKGHMPDTPCKKSTNGFPTMPAPVPGSAIAKARHIRHSFGTPSTPFHSNGNQSPRGTFGDGFVNLGSGFGDRTLTRQGSFLSLEGGDNGESPETKSDSLSSNDYEMPPTPTKQALTPSINDQSLQQGNRSPYGLRSMPLSASAIGYGLSQKFPRMSSKLNLLTSRDDPDADESDVSMDLNDSPTTANFRLSLSSSLSLPSFSRSRALRGLNVYPPAPLIPISLTTSFVSPSRKPGFAKFSHVAPASPLERIDFIERISPRTPHESMLPPDNTSASIYNKKDGQSQKQVLSGSTAMPPPATPTTGRDYFTTFRGNHRKSVTPINDFIAAQVDEVLTSRFDKVELVGTGEFSQVYRVTQPIQSLSATQSFYFGTPGSPLNGRAQRTLIPDRVFAVKKSRQPYQGIRDRQRKLQEANVLKELGHSDHVVHLIDSWEAKDHLYIQTEFCEEGSLDLFLSQVGRKGRLDDFRIWKILLELGQGLKHIHDSGYIHLDLKPANIFITFEGVLKIGDFGMATAWPAQSGIEGEGDREYIGPEILLGQYDKPADVFALGLIMLEIAGNVQLPENGPTWQRLRSGDMSDVPSLTWSSASTVLRDAAGIPIEDSEISLESFGSDDEIETEWSPTMGHKKRHSAPPTKSLSHNAANLFGSIRRGELHRAPAFMRDQFHEHALDSIVKWMISPRPEDRPTVHHVLESDGICWVGARRRAGATVFEGNWGPADDVLADDEEMMDV